MRVGCGGVCRGKWICRLVCELWNGQGCVGPTRRKVEGIFCCLNLFRRFLGPPKILVLKMGLIDRSITGASLAVARREDEKDDLTTQTDLTQVEGRLVFLKRLLIDGLWERAEQAEPGECGECGEGGGVERGEIEEEGKGQTTCGSG